jgi:hypothetical protein
MRVRRALTSLCEEPDHSFTFNIVFRRRRPGQKLGSCSYSFSGFAGRLSHDGSNGMPYVAHLLNGTDLYLRGQHGLLLSIIDAFALA